MFNILRDKLPEEWNGHKMDMRTSIGIKVSQCLDDEDLDKTERIIMACELIFLDYIPQTMDECMEALTWFFSGWNTSRHKSKDKTKIFDFEVDQWRIYASFLSQYRIDLSKDDIHLWLFMGLLSCLDDDSSFRKVVAIRSRKITSKMSREEKEYYQSMKQTFSLDHEAEETPEEKVKADTAVQNFLKQIGK